MRATSTTSRTRCWRSGIGLTIILNDPDKGSPTPRPLAARASRPAPPAPSRTGLSASHFCLAARVTTASCVPADPSSTLPPSVRLVQARFLVEIGLEERADRARDVPSDAIFLKSAPQVCRLKHVRGLLPKASQELGADPTRARCSPGSVPGYERGNPPTLLFFILPPRPLAPGLQGSDAPQEH